MVQACLCTEATGCAAFWGLWAAGVSEESVGADGPAYPWSAGEGGEACGAGSVEWGESVQGE